MSNTYTLEDNVSQINITYHLAKQAVPIFYLIIVSMFFQVFFLWVLIGGGEAALGISISNEPMKVIELWPYIVFGLFLMDLVMAYILGWAMIAQKSFKMSREGFFYTSKLFSAIRIKNYNISEINDIKIKEESNKGNISYIVEVLVNDKLYPVSPTLSNDDAQNLVEKLETHKLRFQK